MSLICVKRDQDSRLVILLALHRQVWVVSRRLALPNVNIRGCLLYK